MMHSIALPVSSSLKCRVSVMAHAGGSIYRYVEESCHSAPGSPLGLQGLTIWEPRKYLQVQSFVIKTFGEEAWNQ